jgi:hypothetical protein
MKKKQPFQITPECKMIPGTPFLCLYGETLININHIVHVFSYEEFEPKDNANCKIYTTHLGEVGEYRFGGTMKQFLKIIQPVDKSNK